MVLGIRFPVEEGWYNSQVMGLHFLGCEVTGRSAHIGREKTSSVPHSIPVSITPPNQAPEPTAGRRCSSAFAGCAVSRRWLIFGR